MATAWELCSKLGFLDGVTFTRGSSDMLLHEIEAFVKTWDMSDARTNTLGHIDEIHRMTNSYLYSRGAGDDHWGKALSNGYWSLLEWPKDSVKITDLLRELFSLVVKKQPLAKDTTLVASNSDGNISAESLVVPPASSNVQEPESHVGAWAEQGHADYDTGLLATRPCSKDIHSTSNAFEPVENEPAPVTATSEEKLVDLLATWKKQRPNTILGGLYIFRPWLIKSSLAQPTVITHNQETFQLTRFQVDKTHMGWILKRIDGSCMLVKLKQSNRKRVRYHLWLGGDLGFTSEIVDDKATGLVRSMDHEVFDEATIKRDAADCSDSDVPVADQRTCLSLGKENIHAEPSVKARSPKLRRVARKKLLSKRLLQALELQRTTSHVSEVAQLPPAPRPQANQPKPSSNKNVIFQFFLADAVHGAIPQPLENCETMSSFFDEALVAWGALGEEHDQPRMAAVQVIIEGVSRPIVVLWRNREGFERMMDAVLEQAADKQTKLNVEVRCFKRG